MIGALEGNKRARASIARQRLAGMPVPIRNWQIGDTFWWLASGCYTHTWKAFVGR